MTDEDVVNPESAGGSRNPSPSRPPTGKAPSPGHVSETRVARILRRAEVPMLVAVPVVLLIVAFFQVDPAALLTFVVALVAVAVFLVGFETSHPTLRQIMPTVVLAAIAAAGRILFYPVPSFQPVSAICVVAGAMFGRRSGFMTGALAALTSNFFFGQGAWTPWQMYAWGLIGYVAGILADHGMFDCLLPSRKTTSDAVRPAPVSPRPPSRRFRPRVLAIYAYGFIATMLYGLLLSTWTFVGFIRPLTWESALLTYGAGVSFDLIHAGSTVIFLLVIYAPWRRKLERIKVKYALSGQADV